MCTYKISIDDSLAEQVRLLFSNEAEISLWMQSQLETLLLQISNNRKPQNKKNESITYKLRGIAKAPDGFDYKQELANRN